MITPTNACTVVARRSLRGRSLRGGAGELAWQWPRPLPTVTSEGTHIHMLFYRGVTPLSIGAHGNAQRYKACPSAEPLFGVGG